MKKANANEIQTLDPLQLCGPSRIPVSSLRLNALDFSDLWDEQELQIDDVSSSKELTQDVASSPMCMPPAPPPPVSLLPSPGPLKGRTLRLHWRALDALPVLPNVSHFGTRTIWAGLDPAWVDTNKLQYLFESKSSRVLFGNLTGDKKDHKCLSLLGVKRSNIITIALSSLPPPHLLPPAIICMDSCVLDREDLQKLHALVPSEEELSLIKGARSQCPSSSLGPAEQCLLTLGGISYLRQRLQLWTFALDYDSLEREIAEPLYQLKLAMEQLASNETFRCILATVLAIGNFLNGCKARGFELSYLGKLSHVRDTQSRQPLMLHVCELLLQMYPHSSDLYSEIPAVARASKCDYAEVQASLCQLETLLRTSWEHLQLLQGDGRRESGRGATHGLARSLPGFLRECEERLRVLKAVRRRVMNRFHSFLLYLGYSRSAVKETRAEAFCKTVSDFALEYRATRLAALQRHQKVKEQQRENDVSGKRVPQQAHAPQQCPQHTRLAEVLKTPEIRRHRDPSRLSSCITGKQPV